MLRWYQDSPGLDLGLMVVHLTLLYVTFALFVLGSLRENGYDYLIAYGAAEPIDSEAATE